MKVYLAVVPAVDELDKIVLWNGLRVIVEI